MSVVLPAPFGPTSPTRSPWNNSKETPSNNGPRSNARERFSQLSNSISWSYRSTYPRSLRLCMNSRARAEAQRRRLPVIVACASTGGHAFLGNVEEAADGRGIGDFLEGAFKERAGFLAAADEPELITVDELQNRVVRMALNRLPQAVEIVGMIDAARAVQFARVEDCRRPVWLSFQAGNDFCGRLAILAQREQRLRQQELGLGIFRISRFCLPEMMGRLARLSGRKVILAELDLPLGFGGLFGGGRRGEQRRAIAFWRRFGDFGGRRQCGFCRRQVFRRALLRFDDDHILAFVKRWNLRKCGRLGRKTRSNRDGRLNDDRHPRPAVGIVKGGVAACVAGKGHISAGVIATPVTVAWKWRESKGHKLSGSSRRKTDDRNQCENDESGSHGASFRRGDRPNYPLRIANKQENPCVTRFTLHDSPEFTVCVPKQASHGSRSIRAQVNPQLGKIDAEETTRRGNC